MRTLVLVGPAPPPSGGVASHVADLAAAATALGARVGLVDTSARGLPLRLVPALARAHADAALVHLHTNGHNKNSWRLAALCARLGPAPSLLTVHSGLAPSWIAAHATTCRRAARAFTRVVCVSDAVAEALLNAGVERERLVIAPAFSPSRMPLPLVPPGLRALRRRCAPLLCAALAPGREYGADVLLDAFARHVAATANARPGLVVFGPATRAAALEEEIARRGLVGRVHCYGDLRRAEALAAIRLADLFLRPTRADGDSVSVREALALGTRVLASDAAVRPSGVQLFPAGDATALAHAIAAALDTPAPSPTANDPLEAVLAVYRALGLDAAPASASPFDLSALVADAAPAALAAARGE